MNPQTKAKWYLGLLTFGFGALLGKLLYDPSISLNSNDFGASVGVLYHLPSDPMDHLYVSLGLSLVNNELIADAHRTSYAPTEGQALPDLDWQKIVRLSVESR